MLLGLWGVMTLVQRQMAAAGAVSGVPEKSQAPQQMPQQYQKALEQALEQGQRRLDAPAEDGR
ncbi:hypothetical protein [Hydrogenophaga sp.]|uniref:hypothetical protein n=1 Tax=Hydrogenophaga sp. TaxID=1904254 RepID=UPI003D9B6E4D